MTAGDTVLFEAYNPYEVLSFSVPGELLEILCDFSEATGSCNCYCDYGDLKYSYSEDDMNLKRRLQKLEYFDEIDEFFTTIFSLPEAKAPGSIYFFC